MIIIVGLFILVAAVIAGLAGVLVSSGSGHASPTDWRCSATT